MSTTGSSAGCEGMYSKLIDTEAGHEEVHHGPDVGHSAPPMSAVGLIQRLSAAGPYRLATICLAALCAILLISIIAVTAQYKNKPQGGGEAPLWKQTQEVNVSTLTATINQLKQEKERLQKERDYLQAKLAAKVATKAPAVVTLAPITCPNDWHLFNNSCYLISRNSRDWPESKSFCESQGAHLAIIHTAEEQTFLWNLLPRGHWNSYWFGITDGETEDEWKWVDGTPVIGGLSMDPTTSSNLEEKFIWMELTMDYFVHLAALRFLFLLSVCRGHWSQARASVSFLRFTSRMDGVFLMHF